MINVLSMVKQVISATTALMPSVMAVMNLATLPRTALTRFLHQEHHATMADVIQCINTSTTRGTDHTPIMVPDIGDISAGNSHTLIPNATEAAVLGGTPHTLLPATTAAHAATQLMNIPIIPCVMIPTGIVILHPTFTSFAMGATHTTPQTRAGLIQQPPLHSTRFSTQESQATPKTFNPHKLYCPKTVTIQDSPSDSSSDCDSDSDPLNY